MGEAFTAGLVLDGLDEPRIGPEFHDPQRLLSWLGLPQIPPVLVARLRPRV